MQNIILQKNPAAKLLGLLTALSLVVAGHALGEESSPGGNEGASKATATDASESTGKVEAEIPKSVFAVPASSNEGRDPFFPKLWERVTSTTPENTKVVKPSADQLVLQGISGGADRRLCVINGRTLAVGDEQEVSIPGGVLKVKCLEINETFVVIELAGSRRELQFKSAK